MEEFEKIKQHWQEQTITAPSAEDFKNLKQRISQVAAKQKISNIVLLLTAGILVYFFYHIGALAVTKVALALAVMIGVLLLRVAVELFSIKTLKKISTALDFSSFNGKLQDYYKNRIGVHVILTPIAILIYCFSFWTLLPSFKANLSEGFYHYIIVSSIVVLVVLGILIFTQVYKELQILKGLKKDE